MNQIKEIKIFKGNICKKFIIPQDFEKLINLVSSSFNLLKENINFSYIDDEGDKIRITNQLDYEQYIKINEKNNSLKIKIEKNNSGAGTENSPNSPITQSLLMFNSQVDEEILFKDEENFVQDLKYKIKYMIKTEIEEKIDDVKLKLINSMEYKLNNIFQHIGNSNQQNLNTIKRNKSNPCLKRKDMCLNNNLSTIPKNPLAIKNKNNSSNNILNLNSISHYKENKICRRCGHSITTDYFYKCFYCEDIFLCFNCEKEDTNIPNINFYFNGHNHIDRHILLKIKNPDSEHLESLQYIQRIKKIYQNKRKFIKEKEKYFAPINESYGLKIFPSSNPIAFNNLTYKIIIVIEHDENGSDFYKFNINLVKLSNEDIKRNSYLECIFDQSDIFGNKINFDEIVKGYEEFNIKMMFYNFKNKPSGYYTSKWKIISNGMTNFINLQNSFSAGAITFVFYLKSKIKDFQTESEINLVKNNSGSSMPTDYNLNNLTRNKMKFPDLFTEIIKRHQQNEKK
jgi:hypothetical protein